MNYSETKDFVVLLNLNKNKINPEEILLEILLEESKSNTNDHCHW